MSAYKEGTKVTYRPCFGMGDPTEATVTGQGEKNGQPLLDLDNGHWCYETQVLKGEDDAI